MDGRARVAHNLLRLRSARELSQEALAAEAEVDRSYVSGIERREFNPSVDILDKLAKALTVDLAEFFVIPASDEPRPAAMRRGPKPKASSTHRRT